MTERKIHRIVYFIDTSLVDVSSWSGFAPEDTVLLFVPPFALLPSDDRSALLPSDDRSALLPSDDRSAGAARIFDRPPSNEGSFPSLELERCNPWPPGFDRLAGFPNTIFVPSMTRNKNAISLSMAGEMASMHCIPGDATFFVIGRANLLEPVLRSRYYGRRVIFDRELPKATSSQIKIALCVRETMERYNGASVFVSTMARDIRLGRTLSRELRSSGGWEGFFRLPLFGVSRTLLRFDGSGLGILDFLYKKRATKLV